MGRRVSGLICWKREAPAPSRQDIYTDRVERTGVCIRAAVSCSRALPCGVGGSLSRRCCGCLGGGGWVIGPDPCSLSADALGKGRPWGRGRPELFCLCPRGPGLWAPHFGHWQSYDPRKGSQGPRSAPLPHSPQEPAVCAPFHPGWAQALLTCSGCSAALGQASLLEDQRSVSWSGLPRPACHPPSPKHRAGSAVDNRAASPHSQ